MKIQIFVSILLVSWLFSSPTLLGEIYNNDSLLVNNHELIISKGCIEKNENITILHVSGTHYEMGYQHGWYLREHAQQNLRAFLHSSEISFEELLIIWNQMAPYVPQQYLDEIQGLADGGNVTFEEVVAAYMVIVWGDRGCFGFAAWGPASKSGNMIHSRSFDLPFDIQDPISGRYAHENHVLIIRHPDDGLSSVAASVAGSMHGGGGINAEGIALGQQVCWSNDQTYVGTPAMFRTQMVLDYATNIEEAIMFLTTNSTLGWNFIVSDSKIPVAYTVESTANHSYIGDYNHTVEATHPFWQIDHIVRRTNFFIHPDIARTQRRLYDPSGLRGILNYLLTGEFFFAVWQSYKVMSTDLQNQWGDLDTNTSLSLLREGYRGDTSLLLKIVLFLAEGTSFNRAWNQWAACYNTDEYVVCFASHNTIAYYNQIHYFNIGDLFINKP